MYHLQQNITFSICIKWCNLSFSRKNIFMKIKTFFSLNTRIHLKKEKKKVRILLSARTKHKTFMHFKFIYFLQISSHSTHKRRHPSPIQQCWFSLFTSVMLASVCACNPLATICPLLWSPITQLEVLLTQTRATFHSFYHL